MKYTATLTAVFTIQAENIVEARRVAKRIRAMGEVAGSRRPPKNRDTVRYAVDLSSETLTVRPEPQDEEGT